MRPEPPRDEPVFAPKRANIEQGPPIETYKGVVVVGRRAVVHIPTFNPKGPRNVT